MSRVKEICEAMRLLGFSPNYRYAPNDKTPVSLMADLWSGVNEGVLGCYRINNSHAVFWPLPAGPSTPETEGLTYTPVDEDELTEM